MRIASFAAAAVLAAVTVLASGWADATEMVAYTVVDGTKIPKSLTGKKGDPTRGRAIAINRRLGNCLACHSLPIAEQPFHGNTGPNLAGVAGRLSEGELRLRLVNPKVINPGTMMPAFYRTKGLHRVMKKFAGKPILNAEQVEDVIAYLLTLK